MADPRFTQGRVRVNRHGALELLEAMDAHLAFLLDARETVRDIPEAKTKLNTRIEHTRRVISETERTANEQGWSRDQLQQPLA